MLRWQHTQWGKTSLKKEHFCSFHTNLIYFQLPQHLLTVTIKTANHRHSDDFAPFIGFAKHFVPENVDSQIVDEVDNLRTTGNDCNILKFYIL